MADPAVSGFLDGIEASRLAVHIRQSLWLYPALEIVHILGITVLVGAAFMFDLRLLGFGKSLPLAGLANHLLPWSQRGLWFIVPSGILLFSTNAKALGTDPTFWLKMSLLLIAGLNVLIFHRVIYRSADQSRWQGEVRFPAKISALVSIAVWITIIACGRLLAY